MRVVGDLAEDTRRGPGLVGAHPGGLGHGTAEGGPVGMAQRRPADQDRNEGPHRHADHRAEESRHRSSPAAPKAMRPRPVVR